MQTQPCRFCPHRIITMLMGLIMTVWTASAAAPAETAAPLQAGVLVLKRHAVPLMVTLSGQSVAEANANIRPLVNGVITAILYKPGSTVKKDTPLFQIERDSYLASLELAEAALQSAEAAVPSAEEKLKRYEKLAGKGVSLSDVDTARTELRQAQAAVRSAQADLRTARINLERTTIVSPIDGIVANPGVSIGDLVTSGQSDVLTTVTELDPISVDLAETSIRLLNMRKKITSGQIQKGSKIRSTLILENGERYQSNGVVESVGSNVSTSTGTLTIRVRFANPDHIILPGVFLRAVMTLGSLEAFTVPQLAAEPQADGRIAVWVMADDGTAKKRLLAPEGNTQTAWIVTKGLEDNATLIVDNTERLAEGTPITPVPVHIDAEGVVVDAAATAAP